MTRLLEIITALIIVVILALVVGVALPSTGHVERTDTVSKDIRHVYDALDNFRTFPHYSVLRSYDPQLQYEQSDKWYGTGSSISWKSSDPKVSDGKLTIVSDDPGFAQVQLQGHATLVWDLQNDWYGTDKQFTINLQRNRRSQKLVDITWAYDVNYGWNLISRYSGLYIHGRPDSLIQYSLKNFGDMLASIPNLDYSDLDPKIVNMPQQPILLVSTSAKRTLNDVDTATDAAVAKIKAAMKKLGVHQAGPRIRFTTNYGDSNYAFDVAIPIDSSTLTIEGKDYELTAAKLPASAASAAMAASGAGASSVAVAGSTATSDSVATAGSAPASAASSGKAGAGMPAGMRDDQGRLIVTADVRGLLAFGGKTLQGVWYGSPAGIPTTRLRLKAYAETHGYPFDAVQHHMYDLLTRAYESKFPNGKDVAYDQQAFKVYLPLMDGPEQTPEQAAGMEPSDPWAPAAAGSAPANAGSAPALASSAPAPASTAD